MIISKYRDEIRERYLNTLHKRRFHGIPHGIGCDEIRADMTGRDMSNDEADKIQTNLSTNPPKVPTSIEDGRMVKNQASNQAAGKADAPYRPSSGLIGDHPCDE
ncbi:hypothetical protein [Paenibacillus sp. SSG-1]|nr:hypothetical protein [Paenibacillus sp. SSG-1]